MSNFADIDLSELTLDNLGVWPKPVKVFSCVLSGMLILFLGYYFFLQGYIEQLTVLSEQEAVLRKDFEIKQQQSANLDAYRAQLVTIKKAFGNLIHVLPDKKEIPSLLDDISKNGAAAGLKFNLFDPQDEILHDFYAEQPIQIVVVGTYHQFGDFVSKLAGMKRIVTLHNFTIDRGKAEKGADAKDNTIDSTKPLEMTLIAKTYRYLDAEEQAAQLKKAKQAKEGKPNAS